MRPFSLLPALAAGLLSMQVAGAATTDLGDVAQLDVGGRHACVVTSAGAAKCWGDNTNGILGDGTATQHAWASDVTGLASGVSMVTTSRGWDAMNPDVAHSCALTTAGEVRCWGDNRFGQLGIGTFTGFATTPGAAVPLGQPAISISAGWAHTCALLADGTVACWGFNGDAQLDTPTFGDPSPVIVAGVSNVVQISAGPLQTCALATAGGVKCWGQNFPFSISPRPPPSPPQDVPGLTSGVASISSGGSRVHTCTVVGGFNPPPRPCEKVLNNAPPQGESHICATMVSGAIRCVGSNQSGQLGDGTTTSRTTAGDVFGLGSGGMQVSVAGFLSAPVPFANAESGVDGAHSCAVTTAGTVQCWGRGYCGLLGDGGAASCAAPGAISTTPVTVTGLSSIQSVAAGGEFACALSAAGSVSCWGLGYGSTPLPVIAGTPPTGTVVSASNARLGNISTRADVLTGNNVMIAGFVIGGPTSKTIAIQAIGPALTRAGIAAPLANPSITLVRSSDQSVVATNDDWTAAANASQVQDSGFAPTMPDEPAIVATLAPGAYTAIVSSADGGTGSGVVGIFELDHPEVPLINISTRAQVLTGEDVMIAGFVVQGSAPQKVAITVAGPSLGSAGIINPLGDPMLTLVRQSDGAIIASNDNWVAGAMAADLLAAGFAPAATVEPGVLLSLDPGAYTVVVQGVGNATGVAVVGVFAVP